MWSFRGYSFHTKQLYRRGLARLRSRHDQEVSITGKEKDTKAAQWAIEQTLKTAKENRVDCRYYLEGNCKFGQDCRYNHPDQSKRNKISTDRHRSPDKRVNRDRRRSPAQRRRSPSRGHNQKSLSPTTRSRSPITRHSSNDRRTTQGRSNYQSQHRTQKEKPMVTRLE